MIQDLWDYLKAVKKPIVLYGMGNGADKIISVLEQNKVEIKGIFATDEFVRDKTFHGFKLSSYSSLKEKLGEMTVLLCFGSARKEVLANIKRIACENELFAPDVPLYGDLLFDSNYYISKIKEFEQTKELLCDEKSKQTFENVVLSKLTGKIEPLFECCVENSEPYESFLKFSEDEIYCDLGAYRGDTVFEFVANAKNHSKIYAFEPDVKTFKKLCENTRNIKNEVNINACVCAFDGKTVFSMSGSRGSSVKDKGVPVDCVTLDSVLNGSAATFIKMDIEGEEAAAIKGAEKTILKYKPKMQIACYHRSEDIIEIPKAVLSLRDDYKIYMRHFESLPAWDTCYYFV